MSRFLIRVSLALSLIRGDHRALDHKNHHHENFVEIDTSPQNISALSKHHTVMTFNFVKNAPASSPPKPDMPALVPRSCCLSASVTFLGHSTPLSMAHCCSSAHSAVERPALLLATWKTLFPLTGLPFQVPLRHSLHPLSAAGFTARVPIAAPLRHKGERLSVPTHLKLCDWSASKTPLPPFTKTIAIASTSTLQIRIR